jgi:hypothetical protein
MKKKILLAVAIIAAVGFAGYQYLYRDHRDIASEKADFAITTSQLLSEFRTDYAKANSRYADKTIVVSGQVTNVDAKANSIVVDGKLSAVFANAGQASAIAKNQKVTLKARFVGYDDLLEELKMDQTTLAH